MRAELDPEAEQVQTSGQTEYQQSIAWLESSTTVQIPAGNTFVTFPRNDILAARIRELIAEVARLEHMPPK